MPRLLGLPSVYLAAAVATAVATAVTTAAPLAVTPASGTARRPAANEPAPPYLVTARDRDAARDLVGEVRWRVRRYYTAALPGFATWLTAAEVGELRADPRVRAVEPDRRIHPARGDHGLPGNAQSTPAREAKHGLPQEAGQGTRTAGSARTIGTAGIDGIAGTIGIAGIDGIDGIDGMTVYVLDSGLDPARGEFGDRAWRAFDATGGTGDDCTGHGTRLARRIAGRASGVAPRARLASVRVLGCDGTGSLSDVVAGLDWVRRHARRPAVAVLSADAAEAADADGSPALTTAVRRLARAGVLVTGVELHPGTTPVRLASWPNHPSSHAVIRENPSRTLRTGGF
ncbi:S8 family serine peptidase [Nonomuraea lactucae]|uniref:S8 family serine peptidase n=1 Tax=Nonomuraea lactucae TaxID=2249762 RepID=UPI000DE34511|nr:S8 family serine peptidase [Nonomuraea lactucae]